MKAYLIQLAIVVVGVILANMISSKIGLDSYEVYQP